MPSLVFNSKDGSVRILCCGEDSVIDNFTQEIKVRGTESGAEIANIKEQTLSINIDLPDEFSKASSDDEIDIGRKLDKANVSLSTLVLDNRNGFNDVKTGLAELNKDLNAGFNNLTTMMSEHNTRLEAMQQGQQEHNTRLEAILEKLANKS